LSFTQQPQFVIMLEGRGSTYNYTLSKEFIGLCFTPSKFLQMILLKFVNLAHSCGLFYKV